MPDNENKFGVQDSAQDAARRQLVAALIAVSDEDRGAFRQVYRLTSAKLFGICLRICGNRQAAEDVLQEVYLMVWRRAGGYDPGRASPITWLATIARNRAIDWRRSYRLPPPANDADDIAAIADSAPRPGDALTQAEADRLLHHCLDALDAEQRSAIRTAFFDGLTYAELAARTGVPLGTMKSRVRRGLARLKECLHDD